MLDIHIEWERREKLPHPVTPLDLYCCVWRAGQCLPPDNRVCVYATLLLADDEKCKLPVCLRFGTVLFGESLGEEWGHHKFFCDRFNPSDASIERYYQGPYSPFSGRARSVPFYGETWAKAVAAAKEGVLPQIDRLREACQERLNVYLRADEQQQAESTPRPRRKIRMAGSE
jgi:hypothetical protein